MDIYMIVLRLVHILAGVYWAGAAFFLADFVTPSVRATGETGQKFMQHLGLKTRLSPSLALASTLTFFSGLLMYMRLFGMRRDALASGPGLFLFLGGVVGTFAWLHGYFAQNRTIQRMKKLSAEMSAGGPPDADQIAQMHKYSASVARNGQITAVLVAVSLVGMAVAEYIQL